MPVVSPLHHKDDEEHHHDELVMSAARDNHRRILRPRLPRRNDEQQLHCTPHRREILIEAHRRYLWMKWSSLQLVWLICSPQGNERSNGGEIKYQRMAAFVQALLTLSSLIIFCCVKNVSPLSRPIDRLTNMSIVHPSITKYVRVFCL